MGQESAGRPTEWYGADLLKNHPMFVLLGVLFHALGGFASGSFYLPYKKVNGWSWESYWLVGGIVSWLVAPWVLGYLTVPHLLDVLHQAASSTITWAYF